jgi:hypothetical protein
MSFGHLVKVLSPECMRMGTREGFTVRNWEGAGLPSPPLLPPYHSVEECWKEHF